MKKRRKVWWIAGGAAVVLVSLFALFLSLSPEEPSELEDAALRVADQLGMVPIDTEPINVEGIRATNHFFQMEEGDDTTLSELRDAVIAEWGAKPFADEAKSFMFSDELPDETSILVIGSAQDMDEYGKPYGPTLDVMRIKAGPMSHFFRTLRRLLP